MPRSFHHAGILGLAIFGLACGGESGTNPDPDPPVTPPAGSLDVHQHLVPAGDFAASAAHLIELMDELGVAGSLLLPPPSSGDPAEGSQYNYTHLASAVQLYPDRLGLIGGGKILGRRIHALVLEGRAPTAGELGAFEADARAIAAAGVAGFESLPSGRNPSTLAENLTEFTTLLSHNRDARIVWTHPGWDNVGHASADQIRTMLALRKSGIVRRCSTYSSTS